MEQKNPDEALQESLQEPVSVSEAGEDAALRAPSAKEKMKADIALLKELFPALSAEEIPDEVWESVKNGESLAASYALYF